MNSNKSKNIIYWVLTSLVALVFLGSAIGKFSGNEEALKMASNFGLDAKTYIWIGIVELVCLVLFVIPRTGVIGAMLLAAYMGGAIATHLEHGESIVAPCIIQTVVFLVSFYRFPSLRNQLINSKS